MEGGAVSSDCGSRDNMPEGALVIAIDGPSGSGKSSISRHLALRHQLAYQDTGAMYRALAWLCQQEGTDVHTPCAVAALARSFFYTQDLHPSCTTVFAGVSRSEAQDVTEHIRSSDVDAVVSTVAAIPEVRQELVARQRRAIVTAGYRMVLEGRDTTSVVAPVAHARFLLTASPQVRMARRQRQALEGGQEMTGVQAQARVLHRDTRDAAVTEFERAGDGVVTIDSSTMDFEATLAAIEGFIAAGRQTEVP